jgi:hypothetical protein
VSSFGRSLPSTRRAGGVRTFPVHWLGASFAVLLGAFGCAGGESSPGDDGGTSAAGVSGGSAGSGGLAGAGGTTGGNAGAVSAGSSGAGAAGMGGSLAGAGGTLGGAAGTAGGGSGGAGSGAGGLGGAGGGGLGGGGNGGAGGSAHSWDGCEEFELPPDCTIPEGAVLPGELRCTGLYSDWQARTLRCGVEPYAPAHELWSDGARKQRYVWLPPGETIDVSNPNDFDYPVGTRFWKEFYVGPEGGAQTLGETRLMLRAEAGWLYTAYVWSEDGTTANQRNDGVEDLFGTGHSVPSREQCKSCHVGRTNFILGWDFIMLGEGATGVTARTLADDGLLGGLDPAMLELDVPGDEVERAALAYLHANCGVSCHNTNVDATGNPSGLYLRLEAGALESPHVTGAAAGINHVPAPNAKIGDLPMQTWYDIRPGDPDRSLVFARMNARGSDAAMPPLGTHLVHQSGVDAVEAWIETMTEERGYPAAAP